MQAPLTSTPHEEDKQSSDYWKYGQLCLCIYVNYQTIQKHYMWHGYKLARCWPWISADNGHIIQNTNTPHKNLCAWYGAIHHLEENIFIVTVILTSFKIKVIISHTQMICKYSSLNAPICLKNTWSWLFLLIINIFCICFFMYGTSQWRLEFICGNFMLAGGCVL